MRLPHYNRSPLSNGIIAAVITVLVCAVVLMVAPGSARADYSMPAVKDVFERGDLAAVDLTVDDYDGNGHAFVTVHDVLYGEFEYKTMYNVAYTCFGGSLEDYGVAPGRYVILVIDGNVMLEEQSYFPVTEKDGEILVEVGDFYADWLGLKTSVVTRDLLKARLDELGAS